MMQANHNATDELLSSSNELRWEVGEDFHDTLMEALYEDAARIADKAVNRSGETLRFDLDRTIDRIVTSKWTGFPVMLLLLAVVFWLTIVGANVPSAYIASALLNTVHPWLMTMTANIGFPAWLQGLLINGAYLSGAWVVAVMLPPMAVFFPIFTLLEDFGYLPRVAFNLDAFYRRAGAHGKQALTMTMGFGCNAAGVVATRVIDSPRERLIAIVTNNFSLCNGRWPTQILMATIFIGALVPAHFAGAVSAAAVVFVAVLGVAFSLAVSWMLSRTVLKGEASAFSLELPPYRPPRILQTLYTSLISRTAFVLWRAVVFAVPAGMVIWLVANVSIGGVPIAQHIIRAVDPYALFIGLNGVIILAYIIAIPANEIVIPTVLMLTVLNGSLNGVGAGAGVIFDTGNASATAEILRAGGWTALTGINLMLFSLLHNPCSTTIYTIYKETHSVKWALVSTFLPIVIGIGVCFVTAQVWRMFVTG
jgi:ferrous iron transport protein B